MSGWTDLFCKIKNGISGTIGWADREFPGEPCQRVRPNNVAQQAQTSFCNCLIVRRTFHSVMRQGPISGIGGRVPRKTMLIISALCFFFLRLFGHLAAC